MADPDHHPQQPQPEPPPQRQIQPENNVALPPLEPVVHNDDFFPAWRRFTQGLKSIASPTATTREVAEAACKARVDGIVTECNRLNQKYRDSDFDLGRNDGFDTLISLDNQWPMEHATADLPSARRVDEILDKPQFFTDVAKAKDVHQGRLGDCWFLAAVMAITAKEGLLEGICVARNEKVGVYGFVFCRDGRWIHEVVDDQLFLKIGDGDRLLIVNDSGSGRMLNHPSLDDEDVDQLKERLQKGALALYGSHCNSTQTWLPLLEKAFAKAHGDYFAIEGGFSSEGIEDLTGGVATSLDPQDISDKDLFWRNQMMQVNKTYLFGAAFKTPAKKGLLDSHAYAVLQAWEGPSNQDPAKDLRLLRLRNPMGKSEWEGDWSDGSEFWTPEMMEELKHTFGNDGVFWMRFEDFLKHSHGIDRVRIFPPEWQLTQAWTSVNIPHNAEFLNTKFELTVHERTPLVIVLFQPDRRYFNGLQGRYSFSLHFEVKKEGEAGYLVRSMHNSGKHTQSTRSVSAEIDDLECGKYVVELKVTATRDSEMPTAEEAIERYAITHKGKLNSVGRRFEQAQFMGNLEGLEVTNRKNRKWNREWKSWNKNKALMKKYRKFIKAEKKKQRGSWKRTYNAMKKDRRDHDRRDMVYRAKKTARWEARLARERTVAGLSGRSQFPPSRSRSDAPVRRGEAKGILECDRRVTATNTETDTDETDSKTEHEHGDQQKPYSDPQALSNGAADSNALRTTPSSQPESKSGLVDKTAGSVDADRVIEGLSHLSINPTRPIRTNDTSATGDHQAQRKPREASEAILHEQESDLDYPDDVEMLDQHDFDWDSDLDAPPFMAEDSDDEEERLEMFGDDEWNAMLCLGLRVHSEKGEVEVQVVKGKNNS
ncbi:hypothetical protein MBLNU230_g0800t1 [Neophaeotheca triangularis]